MTSDSTPLPDAFMALEGAYLDAYNAIVQPDRIVRVSRYLLTYWISDLDAIGTWLLIELRQRCRARANRRAGEGKPIRAGNWWRGKQSWIADAIHADVTTIRDKLNDSGHPIQHFILDRKQGRRYSQRAGRSVPNSYRYAVAMDDPLALSHQAALRSLLAVPVEELAGALQGLVGVGNGDLYQLLEQNAQRPSPAPWLPTVSDVVRDLHGAAVARREEIARLCSELNHNITRPDLVVLAPWYFRDGWLPHLGHRRALMVLALRARCFFDEERGVDRNEIQVSWAQLREQLGTGRTQMYKLRDHPDLPKFYEVLEEAAGRRPARVRVGVRRIPLAPEDEEPYRSLLTQQGPYAVDPETGQMDMLDTLQGEDKPFTFSRFGTDKPFTFSSFGTGKPFTFPPYGSQKPFTFSLQTSIALKYVIAPDGISTTIAPAGSKTGGGDALSLLSLFRFHETENGRYEILIPAEWADALDRADCDRDRVSVLTDMARAVGLSPPERQTDRRELDRLMVQHGGGPASAQSLAAALWYMAIAGGENAAVMHQKLETTGRSRDLVQSGHEEEESSILLEGGERDAWATVDAFDLEQKAAFDDLLQNGVRPDAAVRLVQRHSHQLGRIQYWIDHARQLVEDGYPFTNYGGFIVSGIQRNETPPPSLKPYRYDKKTRER